MKRMQVKVASWNIWKSKNVDEVTDFLKKTNADIICLQEVVQTTTNNVTNNAAHKISRALNFQYIYHAAVTSDRHETEYDLGNAILSKYPIINSSCHFLSDVSEYEHNAETEPRNVVIAEISLEDKTLHVASTHLAYSDYLHPSLLRTKQIHELVKHIPTSSAILGGDFNNIVTDDELKPIWAFLKSADSQPTRPTWSVFPTLKRDWEIKGLEYRIDNIFVAKDINVIEV